MKRNVWLVAAVVLTVAALLFGCTSNAGLKNNPIPTQAPAAPDKSEGNAGDDASGGLPLIDPGKAAESGKKIIYNAEIVIEAESAEKAANRIIDKAAEMGGYLADSYIVADGRDNAESYITVRIPPEKLKDFTAFVGTLGKGVSRKVDSQDVTDQYYDVESRLNNAKAQEAQYLELMKQAYRMEDILAVREKLDLVQREIEQYKGQMRLMDNQVGFATVRILIRQPPPPAVTVDEDDTGRVKFWGFAAVWQKISRGFVDGFNWTLNAVSGVLMVLAYAILPLAFVGAVTLGILWLVRVIRKSNLKRKQARAVK